MNLKIVFGREQKCNVVLCFCSVVKVVILLFGPFLKPKMIYCFVLFIYYFCHNFTSFCNRSMQLF